MGWWHLPGRGNARRRKKSGESDQGELIPKKSIKKGLIKRALFLYLLSFSNACKHSLK
jgi:hypothetical protein